MACKMGLIVTMLFSQTTQFCGTQAERIGYSLMNDEIEKGVDHAMSLVKTPGGIRARAKLSEHVFRRVSDSP